MKWTKKETYSIYDNKTGCPIGESIVLAEQESSKYFAAGERPVMKLYEVARLGKTCFSLNYDTQKDVFLVKST